MRLGLINNPSDSPSEENSRVARAIWAAMQTQTANNAKNYITKLAKEETAKALETGADVTQFTVGVKSLHTRYTPFCLTLYNTVLFFKNSPVFLSSLQGMDVALFKSAFEGPKFDFLLSHAVYCRDVLKLGKGQRAVISNGRVSGQHTHTHTHTH